MPGERRGAPILEHVRHGVQLQAVGQLHFPVLYAQAGRYHLHRHTGGRHRGLSQGQTGLAQGRRQDRHLDREARRSHLHAHLNRLALLRARPERPRDGSAAESQDELAAFHSITSSARKRTAVGNSMPMAVAVLRLTTNWYFVGCSTDRSAGFAPLRIFATKSAIRRKLASMSTPYDMRPPNLDKFIWFGFLY